MPQKEKFPNDDDLSQTLTVRETPGDPRGTLMLTVEDEDYEISSCYLDRDSITRLRDWLDTWLQERPI